MPSASTTSADALVEATESSLLLRARPVSVAQKNSTIGQDEAGGRGQLSCRGRTRRFYGDRARIARIVPVLRRAGRVGGHSLHSRSEHRCDCARRSSASCARRRSAPRGASRSASATTLASASRQLGPPGAHVGRRLVGDLRTSARPSNRRSMRQVAGEQLEQHRRRANRGRCGRRRRRPAICSGDMNDGVPSTTPVRVRLASAMRAMPKSVTFTLSPVRSIITLAGLMSRCTTPWRVRIAPARRRRARRCAAPPPPAAGSAPARSALQVAALEVFHRDVGERPGPRRRRRCVTMSRVLQPAGRLGLAEEAARASASSSPSNSRPSAIVLMRHLARRSPGRGRGRRTPIAPRPSSRSMR